MHDMIASGKPTTTCVFMAHTTLGVPCFSLFIRSSPAIACA
jgi:hypothetical protein